MKQHFANKSVLIIGASGGLGESHTRAFLKEGARLLLVSRNKEKLSALAEQLQGDVSVAEADITSETVFWVGGVLLGKEFIKKIKQRVNPLQWLQSRHKINSIPLSCIQIVSAAFGGRIDRPCKTYRQAKDFCLPVFIRLSTLRAVLPADHSC